MGEPEVTDPPIAAPGPPDAAAVPAGDDDRVSLTTAFRSRDFLWFWLGALVSNAGTWLQNITIPFVLYRITESELWVGLSTFSLFLPVMLFGPIGGNLADRHDRRRVLLATQTTLAVVGFVMWGVWASGNRSPGLLLALTAATGVVNGLNIPSWQSFVPGLVPRKHLTSAITLNSLQFNAARAIGPAVGGLVLATLGASWAFFLNAVSFGFVLAALLVVRARHETPKDGSPAVGIRRGFLDAISYIRVHRGIAVGISVAVIVGFFGNPVIQFTVVFAEEVFERGAIGVGILSASLGVGAVLAAPIAGGGHWLRSQLTKWGLFAYGTAIVAFAVAPHIAVAAAMLVLAGGGFLVAISITNTAVQLIVSDKMRGRVMAVRVMSFTAAYPIGGLLQGWLAELFGPRPVVGVAGACLLVTALALAANPERLRLLDREEPAA